MAEYELFARCASGFEQCLAGELKRLRMSRVRPLSGGVAFFGDLGDAYRACLWSRVATRILLMLSRIDATDADTLYAGIRAIDWSEHISADLTISIHAHGVNDELRNTQFIALKVKDAICDQQRDMFGKRSDVEQKKPDVLIDVRIRGQKATISLDLSGDSLHRRGYREEGRQSEAPLKETLAAGIILASGWDSLMKAGASFVDPMCGSGTLVIEAAMAAADIAPGIMRDYWGFEGWKQHDAELWGRLLDEADERAVAKAAFESTIIGSDIDPELIGLARANAKRAGVVDRVEFRVAEVAGFGLYASTFNTPGLIAVNPPYGERLSTESQLPALYASFAEGLDALGEGWELSVITPDTSIDAILGLEPSEVLQVFNGKIEATLRRYKIELMDCVKLDVITLDGHQKQLIVSEKNSDQFIARFRKVAKERMKWARKKGISCFRLYDADLPDYAVAIDLYEGVGNLAGKQFIHVAEYQAPSSVDEQRALRRYRDVLTIVPAILGIEADQVFTKTRKREKGGGQYRDSLKDSFKIHTSESGYLLEVDLSGYLDTGIFLDHRLTRELIGSIASDKRFLNLFGYTGVATVHAAGGGAASTKTVDLSKTYLAWAERNMKLNGFGGRNHQYINEDVLEWLSKERAGKQRYELIFVDPPTFSNSKSMKKESWSVQRDHAELIISVSRLLAPGGKGIFSCNLRSFKPDSEKLEKYGVELTDITSETIPEDFKRNQKIHHCYTFIRA